MSAEIVFSVEKGLFFKILCFQQPPKCYGNDLTTCTLTVRIPYRPNQVVHISFSYSIIRQNVGRKSFFGGKWFFFSKYCVFNNLVNVTETI